jgi:NAD(P)H-nitrite reductase large subunit
LSHDLTTDTDKILALLPNAYMQGEVAGVNMAGGKKSFQSSIAMNAMGVFDLHYITAGSYDGEEIIVPTEGKYSYKKLVVKDGLLKGYILIGDIERAGIYTSLIREQTPLDSIDFDLIKECPQLMAFAKGERVGKLGGVQ